MLNNAQRAEFEALARPLLKFLCDNCHPHHSILNPPEIPDGSTHRKDPMSDTIVHRTCRIFHRWGEWSAPYEFRPLECNSMMLCKRRVCRDCGKAEVHTIQPVTR